VSRGSPEDRICATVARDDDIKRAELAIKSVSSHITGMPVSGPSLPGQLYPPRIYNGESLMDWNRVEGNWKQFAGKVKAKWGKLTDDDLTTINGRREQLEGKIQERYGVAKDQARKEIDDWFASQGF
jgi:uncharacterized protein YjbJ (UPF0337 family)